MYRESYKFRKSTLEMIAFNSLEPGPVAGNRAVSILGFGLI